MQPDTPILRGQSSSQGSGSNKRKRRFDDVSVQRPIDELVQEKKSEKDNTEKILKMIEDEPEVIYEYKINMDYRTILSTLKNLSFFLLCTGTGLKTRRFPPFTFLLHTNSA